MPPMSAGRRPEMLELDALSCGYGPFVAVHGLDLTVPAAGVVALVGANGAGKSSTIMAVAGHVAVHAGAIRIDGEDITRLPPRERLRRGIAVAPEGRRLFPDLTVAENLAVGGYAHPRARAGRSRERVRSEEHKSEIQSLMRHSYAVFLLK